MVVVPKGPRAPQDPVSHRIRVPHGAGEIEMVVQVVGPPNDFTEDDATSIHAPGMPLPRPQKPTGGPRLPGLPPVIPTAAGPIQIQVVAPPVVVPPPAPAPTSSSAPPVPSNFVLGPGGRIGKYELKDKLGQGTFGLVFTARDTDLDRDVAIKILNPSHTTNSDILHRFLQEARASARIAHPAIVTVLDCGRVMTVTGETAYIVLELLGGESLTNRLARSGKIAPVTAIEITRQIASALDAAHRADVLHRDLKPDNIYLVPDPAMPSGERVKVLDFGLAKLGASRHTTMDTIFGTPRYMSPEQCRSATLIDQRSDIYSLGCILFELITGRTPFDGDLRQLIERHQRAAPPRSASFTPDVPPQLDELIDKMLAKDPASRPQSMAAVQAVLQTQGAVSPGVAATMMPTSNMLADLARGFVPGAGGGGLVAPTVGPTSSTPVMAMPMPPQLPSAPAPMPMPMPMPPVAAPVMLQPASRDSGLVVVPPTRIDVRVPGGRPVYPYNRKRRKAPIIAAAIAFFVAAALTAVAARGESRSASAAPAPATVR
jgi:hypothetical protein